MFTFLSKLPNGLVPTYFYVVGAITILGRAIFATTLGIFILSVIIYFIVPCFGLRPLSLAELLLWIDGLSEAYKTALASSMITVAGFIIAFNTASYQWYAQMNSQLKAQAAGEMDEFFKELDKNIRVLNIEANQFLKLYNRIKNGCSWDDASWGISYALGQTSKFRTARSAVSEASVEIYGLIGRNYSLLASGWGLIEEANKTPESLKNINEKMWLHIPVVDISNPNHVQEFMRQFNITEYSDFLDACENDTGLLFAVGASIRAQLLGKIITTNLPMFLNLKKNIHIIKNAIDDYKKR
jgi:hypothetical protein